jgi:hypothetical protein
VTRPQARSAPECAPAVFGCLHPTQHDASLVPVARPDPPARAHPARGVALIATAVILGFFVLRNAWDQGVPLVAANDETAGEEHQDDSPDETDADVAADDAEPAEDDAGPVRTPEELTVRVANTTGVAGAATSLTEQLAGNGYQTAEPTDAEEPRETTMVLFSEGFDGEAAELAQALADPPTDVEPLPDPPPVDPAGAQLVVMLGDDLAQPG